MAEQACTFKLVILSHQTQRGFHLPVALIIIGLVLFVSTKFNKSIIATQQEIVAEQQQLDGLRAAEIALKQGENKVLKSTEKPFIVYTILDDADAATHLENENVWNDTLVNYNLDYDTELLTNQKMSWIDQPLRWWEKYTIPIGSDVQGYYAIEFVSEDKFGNDLGQDKNYQAGLTRVFFRVTAKGVGQNMSSTVLQSHFTKVY